MTELALQITGVSKSFGNTRALDDVSLQAQCGEVLALIGENGAGKSTLLKVLSGAHRPDRGDMFIDGRRYSPHGPQSARTAGVAMIYQELNLAPELSVEDNIMLGLPGTGLGLLRRESQRQRVRDVLNRVGLVDLDPRAILCDQSVATQQLVEIARALATRARLILFDEPTSSLPQADVQRLFQIINQLRAAGIAIIYISHFLEEVRQIADRYAVLRDGKSVGAGRIAEISDSQIITLMVGRDVEQLYPRVTHSIGPPRVHIRGLSGKRQPQQVDLTLQRGEILGIAGLVGAGRSELLRSTFGLDYVSRGSVEIDGRRMQPAVRAAMRAGLGLLSEDRKNEGLAQELSITDNLTMGSLRTYRKWGWLNLRARRRAAECWMQHVQVKAASPEQPVGQLSGGNQQKVAIARILHQQANVLLLDEPTKGIDVGTKAEIYRMMGNLAAAGNTIVFVSSYLPELMAVCDRIGVMARGRLQAVRPTTEWTADAIMAIAVGSQPLSTAVPSHDFSGE